MRQIGRPIPIDRMDISFREFLEAKYLLDERSFNQSVQSIFLTELKSREKVAALDVGTGMGAMLQRLILSGSAPSLKLVGVDQDAELIKAAGSKILSLLKNQHYEVTQDGQSTIGSKPARKIEVILDHCTHEKFFHRHANDRFDIITANAFMDLIPLDTTVRLFGDHLAHNGLFYAAINYDAGTTLFPSYPDEQFEDELLQAYDASMEARMACNRRTGGAKSGRRLLSAMQNVGLDVIAYGSSDWNITPIRGKYLDQDKTCVFYLLELLRKEGERQPSLDSRKLSHWFETRLGLTQQNRLGIIVHQLDILAKKPKV